MLIAAALAAALAAAPSPMPPMTVRVVVARGIAPSIVTALLAETDAIWRATGITFVWARDDRDAIRPVRGPERAYGLRVVINHVERRIATGYLPLGWITFDDPTTPEREICLSYANAVTLLEASRGVVGAVTTMPRLQRETLLARAMGRALAHELGHYLSGSKVHSQVGLMRAVQTAFELFSPDRSHFKLPPAEQHRIVSRFTSIYMASRG
jgi:hypothetical protein